jgi:phytoene dehydrogenase-like protein
MPAMEDLDLSSHGAHYLRPPVQVGLALSDGRALTLHTDRRRTLASIARFSARDAAAWERMDDDYHEFMHTLVLPALYAAPAKPSEPLMALEGSPEGMRYLGLSRSTPADVVSGAFESEAVRAAILFQLAVPRGVVTDYAGLGMLVPLVVTGVEASHLARGGSHAIAHALWRALLRSGGRVRGMHEVKRIVVEGGRAVGVELATGERVAADKAVVSAIDLPQTLLRLLDPQVLSNDLRARARAFKLDEFSLFGVHLALREPPRYRAAEDDADLDQAFKVAIGFEGLHDFQELWSQVRAGALPTPPRLYACCPTLHDPSQAPAGYHTAFCWAPAPYELAGGQSWDDHAAAYADLCLEAWSQAAPNLGGDNLLARRVLSPLDVERKLTSMPRGGVFHGRMTFDQIEAFRPMPEMADGRTPVAGLYLGGACIHPGGGILGACGYIAAGTVLSDLNIEPWW